MFFLYFLHDEFFEIEKWNLIFDIRFSNWLKTFLNLKIKHEIWWLTMNVVSESIDLTKMRIASQDSLAEEAMHRNVEISLILWGKPSPNFSFLKKNSDVIDGDRCCLLLGAARWCCSLVPLLVWLIRLIGSVSKGKEPKNRPPREWIYKINQAKLFEIIIRYWFCFWFGRGYWSDMMR